MNRTINHDGKWSYDRISQCPQCRTNANLYHSSKYQLSLCSRCILKRPIPYKLRPFGKKETVESIGQSKTKIGNGCCELCHKTRQLYLVPASGYLKDQLKICRKCMDPDPPDPLDIARGGQFESNRRRH